MTAASLAISNLVISVTVADALDLPALAMRIPGAELDRRRFPGLIVRSRAPRFTALIFASGKLILTGLTHPDAIPVALSTTIEILRTAGAVVAPRPPPKIVNMVASGTFPEGVALHRLAVARNLEHIEYEPEMFPGLIYRCETVQAVALVFGTGAIVVTGTTTPEAAGTAADEVRQVVDAAGAWTPLRAAP